MERQQINLTFASCQKLEAGKRRKSFHLTGLCLSLGVCCVRLMYNLYWTGCDKHNAREEKRRELILCLLAVLLFKICI